MKFLFLNPQAGICYSCGIFGEFVLLTYPDETDSHFIKGYVQKKFNFPAGHWFGTGLPALKTFTLTPLRLS